MEAPGIPLFCNRKSTRISKAKFSDQVRLGGIAVRTAAIPISLLKLEVMFQSSITSRQRKFCEGFLFFPIRQLKKYGNFIYRQYSKQSKIKNLLDMKLPGLDYHLSYSGILHDCIETQAMPLASSILLKMEGFYALIQQHPTDVSDLIIHYYQELTVCNNVVLRN
jgi:hypothetical protein